MSSNSGKKHRAKQTPENSSSGAPHQFRAPRALNDHQQQYLQAISECDIVFGIGSAGTGKTFLAASYAAGELYYKRIDQVILTRPNVETGRGLGFLPGELDEKYAPYLQPFEQVFSRSLGKGFYEYALKSGLIAPKPIGFMRGASFDNVLVLVDEAQNLTKQELKMLLSRIGKNCKVILSGDPKQVDVHNSGLLDAVGRLGHLPGVGVVEFSDQDIVRSPMCKQVILAYND